MAAKKKGISKRQAMRLGRKARVVEKASWKRERVGPNTFNAFRRAGLGNVSNKILSQQGARAGTVRRRENGRLVTRRIVGITAGRAKRFRREGNLFMVGERNITGLTRTTVTRSRQG